MKILIDTNVIIDTLSIRDPYNEYSDKIFELTAKEIIEGYMLTSSVTDVYFLLRKQFSDTECRTKIETLISLLQIIEVTKVDCFNAIKSPVRDFEDALISVCADRENLDFIITRDVEFLKLQKSVSPSEFLVKFNF